MQPNQVNKKIDTKSMDPTEREAYWRQTIDEQKKSGLSQTQFLKEHGIAATTFSEWKNRLEKPKTSLKKSVNSGKKIKAKSNTVTKTNAITPSNSNYPVELKHASGFSILLNAHINEGLLKKVLKCLAEIKN